MPGPCLLLLCTQTCGFSGAGKLIAVGVVDILPRCLSSKYFFWDPACAALAPGRFSALQVSSTSSSSRLAAFGGQLERVAHRVKDGAAGAAVAVAEREGQHWRGRGESGAGLVGGHVRYLGW